MPNWCECELTITGPVADVDRFRLGLRTVPDEDGMVVQLLESYVPIPTALRDVSSGSESLGFEILHTDAWRVVSTYPWIIEAHGGTPPTTQLDTWHAFVRQRTRASTVTEDDLIRMADRYRQNVEEFGYMDWYQWANAEWGTKWGDCRTRIVQDVTRGTRRSLHLTFESAWAPPEAGLAKVAAVFPTLTFTLRYWEGGMGFKGVSRWQRGELRLALTRQYSGPRGG